MKLANLTSENLIMLDAAFEDRFVAINALVDRIDQAGKLTDRQQFVDAVMKREEEGPTALGEYLAVPHGKSAAVKEPVFACAFVKQEMAWKGIDGDEPVTMIFLLAIPPAEAGSTHMEVLTTLTSSLVDDDFRDKLQAARSEQEIMALFGADEPVPSESEAANQEPAERFEEPNSTEELAQDISRFAYPLVLGVGVLVVAFLFLLL